MLNGQISTLTKLSCTVLMHHFCRQIQGEGRVLKPQSMLELGRQLGGESKEPTLRQWNQITSSIRAYEVAYVH